MGSTERIVFGASRVLPIATSFGNVIDHYGPDVSDDLVATGFIVRADVSVFKYFARFGEWYS